MSAVLTIEQIRQQYVDEWILIAYTQLDEQMNVLAGEVLAHSKQRDEIYEAFDSRLGRAVAVEYTGSIPEDVAYLL
ncbi:hypothetical protein H6G17_32180 [Chroococcidiopsis sp. FACHB-1243]|uniref:hypothetical protein n=1 Tax=Chroococcidiopsis sp. [FACHB-1243] TaxID=2692781 RepID=UPI001781E2C3|nr:hypothetical protein [Chroococcidiopsis sp. [FACHB-1243]]MBD2310050.1 hypothetical protein [Chroococcidiopsis sp. [FACHB-1243]]